MGVRILVADYSWFYTKNYLNVITLKQRQNFGFLIIIIITPTIIIFIIIIIIIIMIIIFMMMIVRLFFLTNAKEASRIA